MKFKLLIKTNMLKMKTFLAFKLSDVVFSMLINVKMPTLVGILTFMNMIISCSVENEKSFITSWPVPKAVKKMFISHKHGIWPGH